MEIRILLFFMLVVNVNLIVSRSADPVILEQSQETNGLGEYSFRFVASDGTERQETGRFKDDGNYLVMGYYSYIDPDGKEHYVEYYADETGYHPTIKENTEAVQITTKADGRLVASLLG